jgi:hypothetical protein
MDLAVAVIALVVIAEERVELWDQSQPMLVDEEIDYCSLLLYILNYFINRGDVVILDSFVDTMACSDATG